jgi:hypothetical protein
MYIYGMWPWKVAKWPWFWAEVAVKAWRDLATLIVVFKVPLQYSDLYCAVLTALSISWIVLYSLHCLLAGLCCTHCIVY